MKKNFRGALICLFILALMGLGVAGVANAATVVGNYSGTLVSDITDDEGNPLFFGPITFKVNSNLAVTGTVVMPNTQSFVDSDGAIATLSGEIDADGNLTATAEAGGDVFTFFGTVTLNGDETLFEVLDGTYTSDLGVTGTWFATEQTVKVNKGNNGFYLGTFAINSSITGKAFKGTTLAVVSNGVVGIDAVIPAGIVFAGTDVVEVVSKTQSKIAAVSGDFDITANLTVRKIAGKIYWTNPDTGKRKQVGTFSLAWRAF